VPGGCRPRGVRRSRRIGLPRRPRRAILDLVRERARIAGRPRPVRRGRWPSGPRPPRSRRNLRESPKRRFRSQARLAPPPALPEQPRPRRSGCVAPVSTSHLTRTRRKTGARTKRSGCDRKGDRRARPSEPQAWPASTDSMAGSTPILRRAISYLSSSAWWKISSGSAGQLSQPFAWISLSSCPGDQPA
jgi:hypothetical protein